MTDARLAWLHAQIDEDERMLLSVDITTLNSASLGVREYVERGHAEVETKRRILADVAEYVTTGMEAATDGLAGRMMEYLAAVYADRPGYPEMWGQQ